MTLENEMIDPEMFRESMDHYNSLQSRIGRNEVDRIGLVPEMINQLKLRYPEHRVGINRESKRFELPENKEQYDSSGFSFDDEEQKWILIEEGMMGGIEEYFTNQEIFDRYIKDVSVRFRECECKGTGVCSGYPDYDSMDCPKCNGSGYLPIEEGAVE